MNDENLKQQVLGTSGQQQPFKTVQELEQAYINAEKIISQLVQKLSELEKAASKAPASLLSKSQDSPQAENNTYLESQKKIIMKYLPYSKNQNAKNLQEFVAGLPQQLAMQLGTELKELKGDYDARKAKFQQQQDEEKKTELLKAIEAFEADNQEVIEKPGRKLALDFYKSFGMFDPENASAVLDLTDKIIAAYTEQQALNTEIQSENDLAKAKLTSSAAGRNSTLPDSKHVYTRAEINEMLKTPAGREKFLKVEKIIFDQMAKGLIK